MPRVFLLSDEPPALPLGDLPRERFLTAAQRIEPTPRGWLTAAAAAVGFAPHVVHAVGPRSAKLAYLLKRLPKFGLPAGTAVVVSGVANPGESWATRRAVAAILPHEVTPAPSPPDPAAFRREHDIPEAARLVVAAGRFDGPNGLLSAVLAFDALKYCEPELYLLVVGDGPERERSENYARSIGFDDFRTRFAPPGADRRAAMAAADIVWVCGGPDAVPILLEAMASGKPVVAAGPAAFAEVLGRPAFPPGDRIAVAARTRELLADPAAAAQLAAADRARALQAFPPGAVAARLAALYDELTPSRP
jgi:glycosyltransferase involved in cell wall biosynthesis